jgi:hypothetical protein
VNFTADSGFTRYSAGVAVGSGGVPIADSGGGAAEDGLSAGSLVMAISLPFPASNETTAALTVR